jgi:hypothetical protein
VSAPETAPAQAERLYAELVRAAAILRVVATALDEKDDVEDESAAISAAVERIEAVYHALDGAEVRHWMRDGLSAGKTPLEAFEAAVGRKATGTGN